MRRSLLATAFVVAAVVAAGLWWSVRASSEDDAGPLRATSEIGTVSVDRPRDAGTTWSATFGTLHLCSDTAATITGVEPQVRGAKPVAVEFYLRTIPDRGDPPPRGWEPLGTALGTAPELERSGELRSATLVPAAGAVVDQRCGRDLGPPLTELLTTLTVDDGGAWVDGVDISYRAGGREHTLTVRVTQVACGSAMTAVDDDFEPCDADAAG